MAAKKKPARVKTVRSEDFTPLEIHAIQIREFYLALRRAGFKPDEALGVCTDRMGWPDWFGLPQKHSEDIGIVIEEEDED